MVTSFGRGPSQSKQVVPTTRTSKVSRFILWPLPGPCLAAASLLAPGVSPDLRSFTIHHLYRPIQQQVDEENLSRLVRVTVWL